MVRRDTAVGLALAAGALALGVVVLSARRAFREAARAAAPSPRPDPPTPEQCAAIETRYREAWQALNHCERDEDCLAVRRGELFTGLDECARFGPRAADTRGADAVAAAWITTGCAAEYALCERVPEAVCRAGRCAERPPAPLPSTWIRVDVARAFHFFLPPDLIEIPIQPEEGIARLWKNDHMRVSFDFSDYTNTLDDPREVLPEGLRIVAREKTTVSGQPALLRVMEVAAGRMRGTKEPWASIAIHIPSVPRQGGSEGTPLSLYVQCKGPPPCAEGDRIVRSIALRHGAAAHP
ncbi:MAG: hypothetical protein QM820_09240 [Minicystis sp.]